LEGAPQLPGTYVYPEAEQAERIYEHPVLEQDFRDAIIWFPTKPALSPIYLSALRMVISDSGMSAPLQAAPHGLFADVV
jgi:hypothetical protein